MVASLLVSFYKRGIHKKVKKKVEVNDWIKLGFELTKLLKNKKKVLRKLAVF